MNVQAHGARSITVPNVFLMCSRCVPNVFSYRRRMVRGVSQRSGWASSGLIALRGLIKAMCFMRWEQGWILVGEIRSRFLMLRDITALAHQPVTSTSNVISKGRVHYYCSCSNVLYCSCSNVYNLLVL